MAKKRDIIIAVIIIGSFVLTIGFLFIAIIAGMSEGGGMALGGFGSKVAVVEVYGTITDSRSVIRQLKKWSENESVKAIVLHVDSPGGGIAPSQEIHNEILRIRKEYDIPIVVSMANVAASGGYYISCAADRIMANPGTITGSIGVIISFPTAEKLFDKIGIAYETVKSGELKDVGSLDREMTAKERQMLKNMVMDSYEQFVEAISETRGMDKSDIYPLADGSVFSGRQALNYGLVDTLGGFEDAVRLAAELGGIEGEPETVREIKKPKGILDLLGAINENLGQLSEGRSVGPKVMYLY